MMPSPRKRQPAGVPSGGEFAATQHDEPDVELGDTFQPIRILHRVDRGTMSGYDLDSRALTDAYTYDSRFDPNNALAELEQIFEDNNRIDDNNQTVPTNRRSMCVGDVVVVGENAWSVESFGFEPLQTELLEAALGRPIWSEVAGDYATDPIPVRNNDTPKTD